MASTATSPARLTPRQAERRARILDAACRLTGEQGADQVSMRAIAAASETAEKTLYNIFGTKDRLIAIAARERSAKVFEEAVDAAPEGGWPMLKAFARIAADLTLADPAMARALATVLVEHADLVGLEQVYEGRIADTLDQMAASGVILPDFPRALTVRLIRMGVMAAVLFWAEGQLSDAELEPYILLRIGETLLPSVHPERQSIITDDLAHVWRALGG